MNTLEKADKLVDEANKIEAECDVLYDTSNVLQHHPNVNTIQKKLVEITADYLKGRP